MGILDKLMFWKKRDELAEIGKDLGLPPEGEGMRGAGFPAHDASETFQEDLGLPRDMFQQPPAEQQGYGSFGARPESYQPFKPQQPQREQVFVRPVQEEYRAQYPQYPIQQHIEVISAKLDALKAGLDAMNQRLANIERELLQRKW